MGDCSKSGINLGVKMAFIQLSPSIPVLTPRGEGLAIFVSDLSEEHHLLWTVCINSTGEFWTFPNPQIRGTKNITFGRNTNTEIKADLKGKTE